MRYRLAVALNRNVFLLSHSYSSVHMRTGNVSSLTSHEIESQTKKYKNEKNKTKHCVNRTFLNPQNKIKDKCIMKQQLLATQIVNDEQSGFEDTIDHHGSYTH